MNIICISGGLGNQLFQYAFSKFINKRSNINASFYIGEYQFLQSKFLLDKIFNLKIDTVDNKLFFNFFNFKYININLLLRFYIKIIRIFRIKPIILENDFDYKNFISNEKNNIFLGYWQTWKYFSEIENELRDSLKFPPLINQSAINDYNLIRNSNNSTSIHIRRGDYLNKNNANIFYQLDSNYYYNAINYLLSKRGSLTLFIFSDDIEWVKNNFNFNLNVYYIHYDGDESFLDLYLMSSCNNNIIANSTFSWWGAWFNINESKIVICPSIWSTSIDSLDIIFPEWIII
jgi:hypothetical protein